MAESLGVVSEGFPFNEEQIAVLMLDTSRKPQCPEPLGGGDDGSGMTECRLEVIFRTATHVEDGMFENHAAMIGYRRATGQSPARQAWRDGRAALQGLVGELLAQELISVGGRSGADPTRRDNSHVDGPR